MERIWDLTLEQFAVTQNAATERPFVNDAALDALREKTSMPTFISDGARGLALAARRVYGVCHGAADAHEFKIGGKKFLENLARLC